MSKNKSQLYRSIDALFEGDDPISDAVGQKVLDLILNNAEQAEKKMYARFAVLISLWLVGYGVANGMLADATILGAEFKDLSVSLLALPFGIALFYYGTISSLLATTTYRDAGQRVMRAHWKKVHDNDVHYLLMPPSFYAIEYMTGREASGFTRIVYVGWMLTLLGIVTVVPLICFAHLSYLAVNQAPVVPWVTIVVVVLSSVVVLRGLLLWAQVLSFTE